MGGRLVGKEVGQKAAYVRETRDEDVKILSEQLRNKVLNVVIDYRHGCGIKYFAVVVSRIKGENGRST